MSNNHHYAVLDHTTVSSAANPMLSITEPVYESIKSTSAHHHNLSYTGPSSLGAMAPHHYNQTENGASLPYHVEMENSAILPPKVLPENGFLPQYFIRGNSDYETVVSSAGNTLVTPSTADSSIMTSSAHALTVYPITMSASGQTLPSMSHEQHFTPSRQIFTSTSEEYRHDETVNSDTSDSGVDASMAGHFERSSGDGLVIGVCDTVEDILRKLSPAKQQLESELKGHSGDNNNDHDLAGRTKSDSNDVDRKKDDYLDKFDSPNISKELEKVFFQLDGGETEI